MIRKTLFAATALAFVLAGPAMAQQAGGVKIGGNVAQTTLVNNNLNAATGFLAKATTSIGAVTNSEVSGNLVQTTLVNNNLNAATGFLAKAGTSIGTVDGAEVSGNLVQTTLVNNNLNAATGFLSEACTGIGVIGENKACD